MYHPGIKVTKIIVSIILVIVILAILFWIQLPRMLSIKLSEMMGVPVTITDMHIRFGQIKIDEFKIANPKGSRLPYAFTADEIILTAPLVEYYKDVCIITSIDVNEIYLGLEFDSISSEKGNWTRLIGNIRQSAVDDRREVSEDEELIIEQLNLNNINTQISYHDQNGKVIDLPIIEQMSFSDISTRGGMPANQIMDNVLVKMLEEVFIRENVNNMIKNIVTLPAQPIRFILAPFTHIFGGKKKEEVPPEETSPEIPLEKTEPAEEEELPPPQDDEIEEQLSEEINPPARSPGFFIRGDLLFWKAS